MNFLNESKAQVGVEYLTISAFLFFAVIVFFAYSITTYNDSISNNTAKNVVESLANAASSLSGLGNGSSIIVNLEFPEGVQSFQVSGKTIQLFLNSGSGIKEYYAESKIDLNSVNLSLNSGFHRVKVFLNNGKVNFSEVQ